MTVVETYLGQTEITEKPYWHMPTPNIFGSIFYNNVYVGQGAILAASLVGQAGSIAEHIQTPYSIFNMNDEKERMFEEVRSSKYPNLPPRFKSFYVFDDIELAEQANREWFASEPRSILECRLIVGSTVHKADTKWLNSLSEEWSMMAEKYWSGAMSENSFPEILVQGGLFFPQWQDFPDFTQMPRPDGL